jgi:trimethylamine:corrinoid methyltransferase-like protein
VFGRAAFAVKILAQVPVGGVKEAHKSSLAKKALAAVYHLLVRGKSASCFKIPDHQTVIFFINLSQK